MQRGSFLPTAAGAAIASIERDARAVPQSFHEAKRQPALGTLDPVSRCKAWAARAPAARYRGPCRYGFGALHVRRRAMAFVGMELQRLAHSRCDPGCSPNVWSAVPGFDER